MTDNNDSATAKIEDKIDAIAQDITETPTEDKDAAWRQEISSALTRLSTDLAALKADQGKSPELAALEQSLARLEAKLEAMAVPAQVPATPQASTSPPPKSEAESPSPETNTETSSETEAPPRTQGRKQRVWI
jgi:hypothetical protein